MNTDKRNFTNFSDNNAFPGSIDKTTGEYRFPALFHIDVNCNKRIWEIKIRLIKGSIKKYKVDWDLLRDDTVPIKYAYLEGTPIPKGTHSQVWVETGVITGKITRHVPSYPKIMNEGKSNERNVFEQGLVDARSLYLKKIENGFKTEIIFNRKKSTKKEKNVKYFPMLVRKYDDEKKNLHYPLYVQPKLDGVRCVVFLNKHPKKKPTIDNVIMYSRQRKVYTGFNDIKKEMLPALIDMWDYEYNGSIYIDGELYKHGLDLQTISGAARNPKRDTIPKYKGIKLWIFDVFYPQLLSLPFKERYKHLCGFFESIDEVPKHLVCVKTHKVKTENEQEKLYNQYLKKKYEGIILRNMDSLYLTHPTKNSTTIRSKFVLKRKAKFTDEFEVVGFKQGTKGRDKGAIIWILKTKSTDGTDKLFFATPNITYEERYKLYKKAVANNRKDFDKYFMGRMMTIEYEDLSKDDIPLRAKSINFRGHL